MNILSRQSLPHVMRIVLRLSGQEVVCEEEVVEGCP